MKTRTLKQIKRALDKATKSADCSCVCVPYMVAKSCRDELNAIEPKNAKQEQQKKTLLEYCERVISWANYWADRIA